MKVINLPNCENPGLKLVSKSCLSWLSWLGLGLSSWDRKMYSMLQYVVFAHWMLCPLHSPLHRSGLDVYNGILYTVCYKLYTVNCILYTVCCILYTVNCILYTVYCLLYTVYCTLYAVYCILYTVFQILYTVYCIMYTVYCIF